jgi:ABC-type lipoprotein release transport system permease subunit
MLRKPGTIVRAAVSRPASPPLQGDGQRILEWVSYIRGKVMTLIGLVARNALRNKRRTVPTILSIAFSILLLTMMMTLWCSFYLDQLGPASALRLFTRTCVFFSYAIPTDSRQKIKSIPGVVAVAPLNLFNGIYKNNKTENGFPQGGTDPNEFLKVYRVSYNATPCQVLFFHTTSRTHQRAPFRSR